MTISDGAVERLRRLDDRPDFESTRYELGEPIGRGGMGVVFRAHDRELDRDVAIKVTAWQIASDTDRLRREARTLAALEHAGVVPVHDVGRLPDGRVFLVMGLVHGEPLDVHARTRPLAARLRLFDRVCDAVAFAHTRGVVHRDLKPANILVGEFGQVQIVDWGLAGGLRSQTADAAAPVGGTDGYMAPEAGSQDEDARADVYALGAILANLAGEPDDGHNGPSATPRALQAIVARARSTDPTARYQGAAELAADVRRFTDGEAVLAHQETGLEQAGRLLRIYRTPIALVLTYLVVRILLLLWRA
jgi:serine/threonine protein kinase